MLYRSIVLVLAATTSLTSAYQLGGAARASVAARPASMASPVMAFKLKEKVAEEAPVVEAAPAKKERPKPSPKAAKAKPLTAAEKREAEIAAARAELEAARAEKAAALAEKEAALKAAGKKVAKAPKAPKAPGSKPNVNLPKLSLPSFKAPAKSAAPAAAGSADSSVLNAALAGGTALGLVPAAALITLRGFLESGKKYR